MFAYTPPDAPSEENPYQSPQSDAHPKRVSYSPTNPGLATGHWLTVSAMLLFFFADSYAARVTYGGVNLLGILSLAVFVVGMGLIGYVVYRQQRAGPVQVDSVKPRSNYAGLRSQPAANVSAIGAMNHAPIDRADPLHDQRNDGRDYDPLDG